jgi:hypothetical protein
MNYDTTRRFPRTLSDAYPDERAHCIEPPPAKNYGRAAANWTLAFAIWFLFTLIAMGY